MNYFLTVILLFIHILPVFAETGRENYMSLHTLTGEYADVREDLEMAITDRGMVINNVSHIGNMLARTREATGSGKQIFAKAEALEFCSSVISRKMMEADPHNIVFCPYIISVYTLPGETNKVYLAYRKPLPVGTETSKKALLVVEKLLQDIIADVTD